MTTIAWTERTWNPAVGCTRVSPGCTRCYAEGIAHRGMSPQHRGLTIMTKHGPRWNGSIRLVPSALGKPLAWKKPQLIFVNSMSDLFHEHLPFPYIAAVFGVMAARPRHTFQVLTKRPKRALEFFKWLDEARRFTDRSGAYGEADYCGGELYNFLETALPLGDSMKAASWPLKNVWIGVSVEDQKRADERIPLLREIPAAIRFLSCEPLLDELDLDEHLEEVDWVIVGGESGPRARAMDLEWAREIVRCCARHSTPAFVKQLGRRPYEEFWNEEYDLHETQWYEVEDAKGGDPDEWPEDLQIRQWPGERTTA